MTSQQKKPPLISSFMGEHAFLSNFHPAPVFGFPTTEHYYQAAKSLDPKHHTAIMATPYPGRTKRLGRKVKLRPYWEKIKFKVMEKALREKFKIPEMKEALLATGDAELLEGNTWHDNDFGNCWCPRCRKIPGKNMLGKLLMKIREELKWLPDEWADGQPQTEEEK